jgi:hypothetical protein
MPTTDQDPEIDARKGAVVIGAIAGEEVRDATEKEHKMNLLEALKLYPKAVGWSIFFSLGIIMYDNPFNLTMASHPQLLISLKDGV